MSSACLPLPSMTDKEVNVRNEWGGVDEAAKSKKTTTRPWFLLFDILLYPINSSNSHSLIKLLRVFLRVDRGIFAIPDPLGCH